MNVSNNMTGRKAIWRLAAIALFSPGEGAVVSAGGEGARFRGSLGS